MLLLISYRGKGGLDFSLSSRHFELFFIREGGEETIK